MTRLRLIAGALAALTLSAVASSARADDAEALFDRGHALMENKATLDEACRTFEASLALADRGDTLLNLAECHRRQGKTATAHAEFDRALAIGAKVGFAQAIKAATALRDQLATKLSHVTVTVGPEALQLPELAITVNGKPWPKDQWNKPIAYDPGPVEVIATAKGYVRFASQVTLGTDKDEKSVVIALQLEPPRPPPPKPPPPPPAPVTVRRPLWPWIVGGAGLALAGAAVAFEVDSRGAASQLDDKCGTSRKACPSSLQDISALHGREVRGFDLFLGLGAAGAVGLGAAAVGFALPSRAGSANRTGVVVSPTSITIESTF